MASQVPPPPHLISYLVTLTKLFAWYNSLLIDILLYLYFKLYLPYVCLLPCQIEMKIIQKTTLCIFLGLSSVSKVETVTACPLGSSGRLRLTHPTSHCLLEARPPAPQVLIPPRSALCSSYYCTQHNTRFPICYSGMTPPLQICVLWESSLV